MYLVLKVTQMLQHCIHAEVRTTIEFRDSDGQPNTNVILTPEI
jgi:hypothetical protein